MNLDRAYYLPRLRREFYQGDAVIHWTLTVFDQQTGWLNDSFHKGFREVTLHAASREGLLCPAYCLMPDHIHFVWMGLRPDTDQKNGMAFLRTHLKPLLRPIRFQSQAHDHVLRDEERKRNAFAKICSYILHNPVKAELVTQPFQWEYMGAIVPGYPKLHPLDGEFWPTFWKLYLQMRHTDAGKRALPPGTVSQVTTSGDFDIDLPPHRR